MGSAMTHLVRSMDEHAPEPSKGEFDSAWQDLRSLLVSEMRRRGLWTSPPSFLGIVGHPSWIHHGIVADALDELTAQCFDFVFVRRHASLRRQAETKPDIDGLVRLGIRHFLLETQRRNDPLGFRLFEVLRRTVQYGEEARLLHLHLNGRRVDNRTWIAARSDLVPNVSASASVYDPEPLANAWTAHYLDELITSSHGALTELLGILTRELAESLHAAGTDGLLRFGTLASAVKNSGRSAWADRSLEVRSIYTEESESGIVAPSEEFEELRRFRRIATCVDRSLSEVDERPKTLRYLHRLWRLLHNLSLESAQEHPALDGLEAGELPSHRQLSQLLDIPRDRLSGLLDTIGGLLRSCRRSMDSLPGSQTMSDPAQPTPSERARASLARLSSKPVVSTNVPMVGQILHLESVDVDGVFWLVLDLDAGGARCLVAPVDQAPILGPGDMPLRRDEEESDWILRGGRQAWVRQDLLRAPTAGVATIDQMDAEAVAEARQGVSDRGEFRFDPGLPAYQEWMEEGPDEAMNRLTRLAVPFPTPLEEPARRTRRPSKWQAIAALLAVAVGGLAYQLQSTQREIDRLAKPIVDLPYREIRLSPESRGEWTLALPPSAGHVQLGLLLPRLPAAQRVRIGLYRQGDTEPVFRSANLVPSLEYTLTLPRTLIADLPLTLKILAVDGAGSGDEAEAEVLYEQLLRWTRETP